MGEVTIIKRERMNLVSVLSGSYALFLLNEILLFLYTNDSEEVALCKLLQECKVTDDVRFNRFAFANLEEANDFDDQKCECSDTCSDWDDEGPA